MKRKLVPIVLCLALVLSSVATAFADTSQGTATTLRLEKAEGTVGITKTGGKSVTVKEGVRLYDGYEIKTDKASSAYISLDSAKAIMLDASTDVTIKKNGKKLEVMLKSGTVLVNVEDKLKGDEELNIRTTNSVTGIRGTILQASYIPQTGNSELYLFEGFTTGQYQAPDGSWYSQALDTGSWLASGLGLLSQNPEFNGWTQEGGHWVYTNSSLEETGMGIQCWSSEKGWYTLNAETGEEIDQEAWPFSFRDLAPATQLEILDDPGMLSRGQEHLDLYPELADDTLPAAKADAEKALEEQRKAAEEKDAAIQEAFEEGNGGNTVDNLFEERTSGKPTYAMIYYMEDPAVNPNAAKYTTQYYHENDTVTAPADPSRTGYTFVGWSAQQLPQAKAAVTESVYAKWTANTYRLTLVDTAGVFDNGSVGGGTYVSDNAGTYIYDVTYDTDFTFNVMLDPAAVSHAKVTGGPASNANKVYSSYDNLYAVTYTIPITAAEDYELNITDYSNEFGNLNHIFVYTKDKESVYNDYVKLTQFSGNGSTNIIDVSTNDLGILDFALDGNDGFTFTAEGSSIEGDYFYIYDVISDNLGTVNPIAGTYDYIEGTYSVTDNTTIITDTLLEISFSGVNAPFTVDNNYRTKRNDMYYYSVDDDITVTAGFNVSDANTIFTLTSDAWGEIVLSDDPEALMHYTVNGRQITFSTNISCDFTIYYSPSGYNTVALYYDDLANFEFGDDTEYIVYDFSNTDDVSYYILYVKTGSEFAFTRASDDVEVYITRDSAAANSYEYTNSGDDYSVTVNDDIYIWINVGP